MAAISSSEESGEDKLVTAIVLGIIHRRRRQKHPKRFWVRSIFMKRGEQGEYHNLLQEMRLSDEDSYFKYLRMSKEHFDLLLSQVKAISFFSNSLIVI